MEAARRATPAEQPGDGGDVAITAHRRSQWDRHRGGSGLTPAAGRLGGISRGRHEPLAEQHGEVVLHQRRQLRGVGEVPVGGAAPVADLVDHRAQPRLGRLRRALQVEQPGHALAEPELVLQAGDGLPGRDPAVALVVDADEHVGLPQIGPVQLARRVRAGAELEHHRGQVQPLDGGPDGAALAGQLTQRGADEDPHPLIRRPDDLR